MRQLLLIATVTALAVAKPEIYKEKEDFQYSRSSSDEGSKAGYYGAQRGNMGGNYERAHNMDTLAQHQMSGLVRQIDGELGDGAKTRTGSVYSAANSRGIYGSGKYDLSNLEGRNFQEGTTYSDSQSRASSLHQSAYNAQSSSDSRTAYSSSHEHNSGQHNGFNTYHSGAYAGQNSDNGHLHTADNLQTARNYDHGGRDSLGYYSNTGYHGSNSYTQSNSNLQNSRGYGSDAQTRFITAMPIRVVVRPGTRVAIPIATQTYDSSHRDSSFDQNAIGSEAEVLNSRNLQTNIKPTSDAKHYESSYSYRKEWEKHDTVPVVVPTISPYPEKSELYEDNQAGSASRDYDASRLNTDNTHSSNAYNRYQNQAMSASSRQTHYNSQHESSSAVSGSNLKTYGLQEHAGGNAAAINLNSQVEDFSSKPKSYQSSYSYHKSWERQGDPYIIKPATNDLSQASQRLTSDGQYGSEYYGSQRHGSHTKSHSQNYYNSNAADCDETGHIRVARSYNTAQQNQFNNEAQEAQNIENFGQQTQTQWDNLPSQWNQLEDGQQNKWENLENLGQQAQNQWDNLENLGQQTQNKWDNLENLGQQQKIGWDQGQEVQKISNNLEDLGQQTQSQWDTQQPGQQTYEALDSFGQSQQDKIDLSQQTQDTWTTLQHTSQESTNMSDKDSINKNTDSKYKDTNGSILESDNKLTNEKKKIDSYTQDVNNSTKETSDKLQLHNIPPTWFKYEPTNVNQQTQFQTNNMHNNPVQNNIYFQQNQSSYSNLNYEQNNQQTISHNNTFWDSGSLSESHSNNGETNHFGSSSLAGLWGKIDKIEKESSTKINKDFPTDISDYNSLNKQLFKENDAMNNNESRDNFHDTAIIKPATSYLSSSNKITDEPSTTTHKIHPSDVGRGDIGPQNSESSEISDEFSSEYTSHITKYTQPNKNQTGSVIINKITNDSIVNAANNEQNTHNLLYMPKGNQSNSNYTISNPSQQNRFINENQNTSSELILNISTTTSMPSIDIPVQSFIIEQQNKQERTQAINEYFNESKYQNTEKQSQTFETTPRPKNPQTDILDQQNGRTEESFDHPSILNLGQFAQESHNFDQQNVSPQESSNKHSIDNLEQFAQQSNNIDQQNFTPQESFDQQSMGNLEQFSQQSDNFNQQNVSPQESFDQQSMGNLEQFSQQSDNFDQQNVSPQESFDQQSMDNLEQFSQQSDNFDHQNVSPQESFDQQSMGNLEQFSQQSDNFDQQNVSPQESFDQQSMGNLDQFSQQSDNFDKINVSRQESIDQHSVGNLEQFSQQSDNFDQQNVSPQESFDQQSMSNLDQLSQQSDNLDQINVSPQESFDQQSMGNLEQFSQQSDNFDQQNVSPQESFDKQSMGNLEQFSQPSVNFDQQNVSPQESFDQQSLINLGQFSKPSNTVYQQNANNDDLVIPIFIQEKPSPSNTFNEKTNDSVIQFNRKDKEQDTDHLVIPIQSQSRFPDDQLNKDSRQIQPTLEPKNNIQQESDTKNVEADIAKKYTNYLQNQNNGLEKEGRENGELLDLNKGNETTTPEALTEKPGFWKSVGNKFASAKDKVASWFGRS